MLTRCSERARRRGRLRPGILLLACAALTSGCAKREPPPPPAPPPPPPLTEWPNGVTPPLKITDELILQIPLQYERGAINPDRRPMRAFISQQSDKNEAGFDFFLPDFSGYTLQNYRSDTDPDKVEVVYLHAADPHEGEPGASGLYPPNMLKRALAETLNRQGYKDQYGLRCYHSREPSSRLTCYGRRAAAGEDIMLTTVEPPYAPDQFPQVQARYFSKQYGGVRIFWRTHVRNLPRWQEIDAQIWKFIGSWQAAMIVGPAAPPPPAKPPKQ